MAAEKARNERELEIGLIGCGSIVEGLHLPALTSVPGTTIKWVCDASDQRARRVARDWDIRKSYAQLCDCDDVDAVLIATPVGTRREILDQTTKRGWHAFCEKPFATSIEEHRDLLRNAGLKGLILGAGYMRRFYWAVEKARQILHSNALGSLVEVVASDSAQLDRTGIDQSSYRNNAQASGGGVLVETGCHLLDQMMFVTDCEEVEVESCEQKIWENYEVETVASGFLKLSSGAEAVFQFTVSGVEPVFQGIALCCESGEIRLRLDPGRALEVIMGKENSCPLVILPTFPRQNHAFEAFRSEWIHFLSQVREPGNWDSQKRDRPSDNRSDYEVSRDSQQFFFDGETMKRLRVGIVGAAGQVGLAVLRDLNNDSEFSAFGICRNSVSSARVASLGLPVRTVQTDDASRLIDATRDVDVLVNCALPQYQPSKTSAANLRLAESLTASCAGKHLLHLSSVAIYGEFLSNREKLFHRPKPDTTYGRQKLQMEQLLQKYSERHSARCTILRVGHVYGPQLRWSEALFELIETEGFRLPFDGQLLSNAVWIKNLIAGIRHALISESICGTLNIVDTPQSTWREVFDLHSHACGCSPVAALDHFESQRGRRSAKKRSEVGVAARFAGETWEWIKHLPASYVSSVPTFKAISQSVAAKIGSERLDSKLYASYCRHLFRRDDSHTAPAMLPLLLSEAVPGAYLAYEGTSAVDCLPALVSWYDAISKPRPIVRSPFSSIRKGSTTTVESGSLR